MAIFKFGFYSVLGILAFLAPITIGQESTILMGHIKNFVIGQYVDWVKALIAAFSVVTIIGTSFGLMKRKFDDKILNELFITDKLSSVLRILGSIMFIMVNFKLGPQFVLSDTTGGLMAFDLLPPLMITFFVGVILMPMLTSFGLVEFVGTMIAPVMKKVFKVPGYAAIDALASFLGDGTIGIVVTDLQYQKGYYTQRQAVIIATSFSIVGISFAAVVADLLHFSSIFWIFYMTIVVSTIFAGYVIARLPMKKFKDEYYDQPVIEEEENRSIKHALKIASETAAKASEFEMMKDSLIKVLTIYVTFIPVIMCVGTIGLILAEYTSFFAIISTPLLPVLNMLGFSQEVSAQMAPAMIVGFSDMYLPALFIESSKSELARFIIGTLSFSQLIFLSETGMILVNSKIGFSFIDTIKFFLLRTILTFPIIYLVGITLVKLGILNS